MSILIDLIPIGICNCGICFEIDKDKFRKYNYKKLICKKCHKEVIRRGNFEIKC